MSTYMNILLNCVQVSQIRVYYYSVQWFKATDRWASCAHQELRLVTKFVIGFLAPAFETKTLHAIKFDSEDAQMVLSLLEEAHEPESVRRPFYFKIPTLSILNSLTQLLLLACDHSEVKEYLQELIAIFKYEKAIEVLFRIMSDGSKDEQLKAGQLVWTLTHLDAHHLVLSKSRVMAADFNAEVEVKEVCNSIRISLDNSQLKGTNNGCIVYPQHDACVPSA